MLQLEHQTSLGAVYESLGSYKSSRRLIIYINSQFTSLDYLYLLFLYLPLYQTILVSEKFHVRTVLVYVCCRCRNTSRYLVIQWGQRGMVGCERESICEMYRCQTSRPTEKEATGFSA